MGNQSNPTGNETLTQLDLSKLMARVTNEHPVGFDNALVFLKQGYKVARTGWNGKHMWVVYQKGYLNGIAINQNTADATGLPLGTVCVFRPWLMLHTAQQEFVPWTPSVTDVLADDWVVVE